MPVGILAIVVGVLAVAALGLAGLGLALAFAAGAVALLRWMVVRRHRSWGYRVDDDELELRRGVLVRRVTVVPIGRMQFLDIHEGPLDRRFGVANLQLHTAAAASDARIPMLTTVEADRLRAELITRGAGRSGGT